MSSALAAAVLAIDTAGDPPTIALALPDRVLAPSSSSPGKARGERLGPAITALLGEAGCGVDGLRGFGVVLGPGSYTGLRVGLALVRGLAMPRSLPVVGVGALELTARLHRADGPVVGLLGASSGHAYAAGFLRRGEDFQPVWGPELLGPAELFEKWGDSAERPVLVGPDVTLGEVFRAKEPFDEPAGAAYVCVAASDRSRELAQLAATRIEAGEGMQASRLLPMYVGALRALPNRNRVVLGAAAPH